MLNRISNKEVRGPGFSVFVPNIHQIKYKQGDRVALVEIEGGMGEGNQVNWVVYRETLKGWEPPHALDEMTSAKRAIIFENISDSLVLLEMPHRFV